MNDRGLRNEMVIGASIDGASCARTRVSPRVSLSRRSRRLCGARRSISERSFRASIMLGCLITDVYYTRGRDRKRNA